MPVRTCAFCRGKEEKEKLFRFVLQASECGASRICLDVAQQLAGRGVYAHRHARCLGAPKLLAVLGSQLRSATKAGRRLQRKVGGGSVSSQGGPEDRSAARKGGALAADGNSIPASMQEVLNRAAADFQTKDGLVQSKKVQAGVAALLLAQKELALGVVPGGSKGKVRFRL